MSAARRDPVAFRMTLSGARIKGRKSASIQDGGETGEYQIFQQSRLFGIHRTLAVPTSLVYHPGLRGGQAGEGSHRPPDESDACQTVTGRPDQRRRRTTMWARFARLVAVATVCLVSWPWGVRADGATYYLFPTGTDGNPGTSAAPWQTFA